MSIWAKGISLHFFSVLGLMATSTDILNLKQDIDALKESVSVNNFLQREQNLIDVANSSITQIGTIANGVALLTSFLAIVCGVILPILQIINNKKKMNEIDKKLATQVKEAEALSEKTDAIQKLLINIEGKIKIQGNVDAKDFIEKIDTYDNEIMHYSKLLDNNKDDNNVRIQRGLLYCKVGEIDKAIADAKSVNIKNIELARLYSNIALNINDNSAMSYMDKAITIAKKIRKAEAKGFLLQAYCWVDRVNDAEIILNKIPNLDSIKDNELNIGIWMTYVLQNDSNKARHIFGKIDISGKEKLVNQIKLKFENML